KPQKLLFLINACFSGHVTSTLGRGKVLGAPPAATLGMEILATGEGRALITASRPSQYSYYLNTDQYTYFGQALLEGLRGASVPNTGGYIGLYELYQHIYRSVRARAESQEPMLTILQGVGPFPVAHYPGATPQALGEGAIQQTPPRGMAVEEVEKSVVVAVGRGAQAWNVGAGSAVDVDQSRNVVSFGRNNTFGNVTMGDVAGRDLIKVTAAQAAGPSGRQELLDLISQLRDDLARLEDAPEGKREDADDELRKAMEAGEKGDGSRLKEKLEAAQRIVLALSATVPAAVKLGAVIGTALQRAMSLFE
ncbi:MAG TPA: hypothetical protein VER55_16485, partial [Ardenticatenaceae bacterium]|nr:hypothetical protein [Ardenticatenaceae bacterium]